MTAEHAPRFRGDGRERGDSKIIKPQISQINTDRHCFLITFLDTDLHRLTLFDLNFLDTD